MVKKMTIKTWTSVGLLLVVCLVIAIVPLWHYGPSALAALQGRHPLLDEPLSNIYGMTGIGLFMLVISLAIFIRSLANPVSKRVNRYLEKHPGVTMELLDQAFDSAEKIGNVWIGGRWTFSHDLWSIVVENADIVRAYGQRERSKNVTNYYLCLELAEGKSERKNERVKMGYNDLTKVLEMYGKYSNIHAENNV